MTEQWPTTLVPPNSEVTNVELKAQHTPTGTPEGTPSAASEATSHGQDRNKDVSDILKETLKQENTADTFCNDYRKFARVLVASAIRELFANENLSNLRRTVSPEITSFVRLMARS